MTQRFSVSAVPRVARFERPRPRLLGLLTESLDFSLVVLVAPSGYGKTTLLAQYARSTLRRVIWCRIGGVYEGPAEVIAKLTQQVPEFAALNELDSRTSDSVLARQLADKLAQMDQGIDLIVDNVEDERLSRWLGELAQRLEEGHRLLVGCHSTEGLRLARRLADGQALVLDADQLAFDAEETQAYLTARGKQLTAAQLNQLAGWPAGLALSAQGRNLHADANDLVLEALQGLPETIAMHLPPLSALEIWTQDEAQQVSGALPDEWLKVMLHAGLPLMPLGGGAYRPHQLLIEVLETLLRRRPEQARRIWGTAAGLAESAGSLERAAALYTQAGEFQQTLRLAETLVARYRNRGEHRLTRALLEPLLGLPLPPAFQERLAWAQIETGSSELGEARLQALHDAGELTPAGHASLATVCGRQGRFKEQLLLAREGLAKVGDGPPVLALAWPLVFASLRLGQYAQAEAAADESVAAAERGDDQVSLAEAWQLQGIVRRYVRPAEAALPLTKARAIYEVLGWHERAADLHLEELEVLIQGGEIVGVAQRLHLLAPLAGAERAVYHAQRLRLLGAVQRRTNQLEQAEQSLREALERSRLGGLDPEKSGITLELADTLLQQGRGQEATNWMGDTYPATAALRAAVLKALITGELSALSGLNAEQETDAETRLRLALLHAAQGDPEHLNLARQQLAINPHAAVLAADRALSRVLAETAAQFLLPDADSTAVASPELLQNTHVLTVVTLGDVQVKLDEHSVHIGLAKARELLVWLALHVSGSRDELVTALWDGSSEERHVEYFKVAVRRLRGALRAFVPVGLDPLPYITGRYRLAPIFQVEVDALSPEHTHKARTFLPGVDTEWVQRFRDQLKQQVSDDLLAQASSSPPAQAALLLRQLLSIDPLLDVAHEGLVRALSELGEVVGARQALQRYEQMLSEEYGTRPAAHFIASLPPPLGG